MLNRNRTLVIILIVLVIIFVTSLMAKNTYFTGKYELIKDLISSITAIIGLLAIWHQMKRDKDLTEAEFIINLNNSFTSNPDIKHIYTKLESNKHTNVDPFTDEDMIKVVDYLTFFETISNLIQRNVLDFDMINDLFAYRFFAVVHNEHIQKREIIKDAAFYENLYALHRDWMQYRRKKKLYIPYEKTSLDTMDPKYINNSKKRVYQYGV